MKFNIIAAVIGDFGIGYQGHLPWSKFTEDMKWFRETTANAIVIMGRKTWESLRCKPLKGRINIIVSSTLVAEQAKQANQAKLNNTPIESPNHPSEVFYRQNLTEALALSRQYNRKRNYQDLNEALISKPVFVIGGSGLYQEALSHPDCQNVYLTRVKIDSKIRPNFPVDCYFSKLSADHYQIAEIITDGTAEIGAWNRTVHSMDYQMIRYSRIVEIGDILESKIPRLEGPQLLYFNETGYLKACSDILKYGVERSDRTKVGTQSLFGLHFRYDLQHGFPLFTSKRTYWKGIVAELLWFLAGQTDVGILQAQGVHIWDGNSSRDFLDSRGLKDLEIGDIGATYGFQFRHYGARYYGADWNHSGEGFDQVEYVVNQIRQNPSGRRAIINLWNPSDLERMALPPCLYNYQFYVDSGTISCLITQRSGDMFLGVPFNVASASLLTHMIGRLTGLQPKELIHNIADAHIYSNHLEAVQVQTERVAGPWPLLEVVDRQQTKISDFQLSDFKILGYWPEAGIKAEMAV